MRVERVNKPPSLASQREMYSHVIRGGTGVIRGGTGAGKPESSFCDGLYH